MNYYNYFTEIEEHFVRRRGKHLMVSPMDWSLISTWRESGVPLHVALRGIDIAMDTWFSRPRRGSDKLSTLFYCHDAVMSEYARHLEAHLGGHDEEGASQAPGNEPDQEPKSADGPDKATILEFLEGKIREIEALQGKHSEGGGTEGIERILSRLHELLHSVETEERVESEALERDLGILDELLVADLRLRISAEKFEEWEKEARKELKVYKKRLPKDTYEKIVDNYMRGRIHRLFQVGELSLFHL